MLADVTHGVIRRGASRINPPKVERWRRPDNQDRRPLPLPGDTNHTYLRLARPLAYCYKRATVTIYANVVKPPMAKLARGARSGDGSQGLQNFMLKNGPLTFVRRRRLPASPAA